jgi:anti-anti-sigma regulatory factor
MVSDSASWQLSVDVSTEWLFFHIGGPTADMALQQPLAEQAWSIAQENEIRRMVVQLEPGVLLSSRLIGQLVLLHKRAHTHAGVLRLCGLSETNYQVLETMRLDGRFPNYRSREDAVMGYAPVGVR